MPRWSSRDRRLVRLAQVGRRSALEAIVAEHSGAVFALLSALDAQNPSATSAEAWRAIWAGLAGYRDEMTLRGWVIRMAYRTWQRLAGIGPSHTPLSADEEDALVERAGAGPTREQALHLAARPLELVEAWRALPPTYGHPLLLSALGLSDADVAGVLEVGPECIPPRLRVAKAMLGVRLNMDVASESRSADPGGWAALLAALGRTEVPSDAVAQARATIASAEPVRQSRPRWVLLAVVLAVVCALVLAAVIARPGAGDRRELRADLERLSAMARTVTSCRARGLVSRTDESGMRDLVRWEITYLRDRGVREETPERTVVVDAHRGRKLTRYRERGEWVEETEMIEPATAMEDALQRVTGADLWQTVADRPWSSLQRSTFGERPTWVVTYQSVRADPGLGIAHFVIERGTGRILQLELYTGRTRGELTLTRKQVMEYDLSVNPSTLGLDWTEERTEDE